ncbi:alkaline shock response membrane anchor protein AmaP [Streptomyces sp. NPDC051940]|uniref:alkaline shock response membrane anchor protein AmaP n=1 Tax=Streptomyces sp. NPDC051940 TaxID=3155675 RepID=UPI00344094E1
MLAIVNRVLLGLGGAVLVVGAAGVLASAAGVPWTPYDGPDDVLLSRGTRERLSAHDWWWPVVIGSLSVLILLALWWLFAQLRRRRLDEVLIEQGESGSAPLILLRGRALEDVLAERAQQIDGVERAHVFLSGRRTSPRARIGLLLGPRAQPASAVTDLRSGALKAAADSTGLSGLPSEVRLRAVKHRPERVT